MDAYVLDESSPLFGLHLKEHPVNSTFWIYSVDAGSRIPRIRHVQTAYVLEDIMIGHTFKNQWSIQKPRLAISDYPKWVIQNHIRCEAA
jgi:hypothetical protein